MKHLKRIANIGYWILIIALFAIGGLAFLSANQLSNQYRLFVVQSGSMEPTIKTGSIVLVQPQTAYQTNDIITFATSPDADLKNPQNTVTHRVAEVTQTDGQTAFTTKGDANNIADMNQTPSNQVLGKVTVIVPYIGYPVGFAKTQTGFVILVIIPATIIIYSELQSMRGEVKKLFAKRGEKKDDTPKTKVAVEHASEEEEEETGKKTKRKKKATKAKTKKTTTLIKSTKTKKKKTSIKQSKKAVVKKEVKVGFSFRSLFSQSRLAKLGFAACALALYFQPWIGGTNAFFTTQDTIQGNTITTGCWVAPSVPVLLTPFDETIATLGSPWEINPVMDWNDSISLCGDAQIQYQYQSYYDVGLTGLAYESAWLNDSMIPAPGTPDGDYYWRVRAKDQNGNFSDWSPAWHLKVDRTAPPFAFLLINPESNTQTPETELTETDEGIQVQITQNDHNLDVSFTNADTFTSVKYYLSYTHIVEGSEVSELIEGEFTKEKVLDAFDLPSLYLGTCSSGGICVSHTDVENLELGLIYKDGSDLLDSATLHPSWVETP